MDPDERVLVSRVVHDHRALGVLEMGDVDRAHHDPPPLEPAEAVVGEHVQRAGQDDQTRVLPSRVLTEVAEIDVDGGSEVDLVASQQAVDQVGVAVGARWPALVWV